MGRLFRLAACAAIGLPWTAQARLLSRRYHRDDPAVPTAGSAADDTAANSADSPGSTTAFSASSPGSATGSTGSAGPSTQQLPTQTHAVDKDPLQFPPGWYQVDTPDASPIHIIEPFWVPDNRLFGFPLVPTHPPEPEPILPASPRDQEAEKTREQEREAKKAANAPAKPEHDPALAKHPAVQRAKDAAKAKEKPDTSKIVRTVDPMIAAEREGRKKKFEYAGGENFYVKNAKRVVYEGMEQIYLNATDGWVPVFKNFSSGGPQVIHGEEVEQEVREVERRTAYVGCYRMLWL